MERVVLIGNCQVHSLSLLYKRFAAKSLQQSLTYIRSYEEITGEAREAIEAADIVVEHVQDFMPKADIAGIETKAERLYIPVVNCGFLWPFAGQAHPSNPRPAFLEVGPYGAEYGDAYLNRMIKKGVPANEAVDEYEKLDVNKMVSLDRLLEITLEKQATRDQLTGFQIADLIASTFREEQPFLTPYHPNTRVALALAAQFFRKLGADPQDTARMERATRVTPFPKEELPVHPAVARHFGLKWAGEERRYSFLSEGRFTFREFSERYMRCEWNEALQEGIEQSRAGRFNEAVATLRAALPRSPQSAEGHGSLSHALDRLGDLDGALAEIEQAIARNPNHASYRLQLGLYLQRKGRLDDAEREIRVAAALDPFDPHYPTMLASFLSGRGAHLEALAVAWQGLANTPNSASLHIELGNAMDGVGDAASAEAAYRRAAAFDPHNAHPLIVLSERAEQRGQLGDAIALLRQALALAPDRRGLRVRLARLTAAMGQEMTSALIWRDLIADESDDDQLVPLLFQAEKYAETEAVARRALLKDPGRAEIQRYLSIALERQGRVADARTQLETALEVTPNSVGLLIRLADLLIHERAFAKAEEILRRAVAIEPLNAHALGQLGHVLSEQGRHDEALIARKQTVELEPMNAPRWAQYGHVLLRAEKYSEARAAVKKAIALAPDIAHFHFDLGHIESRSGRRQEAIAAVRHAIALDATQGRYHAFLAEIHMQDVNDWNAAEEAFREAVRNSPDNAHI
jgi:tetratricopeptide (TPR) repeat protein